LLFPTALGLWLLHTHMATTPIGVVILVGASWITLRKVVGWRRYLAALRARLENGDMLALRELRASLDVPLAERLLVVAAYIVLVPGALWLLEMLSRAGGWLQ
jgi:hypothetical protein